MVFYTLNLNPAIAYQVNNWLSIGGGIAIEYANLTAEVKTLQLDRSAIATRLAETEEALQAVQAEQLQLTEHVSQLQSQLLALVRRLGLVYSTIDLKLTNDGEYVFLELNPQGQFLYVEILSAMPITAAVASLLVRGAQRFPAGYEGKLA